MEIWGTSGHALAAWAAVGAGVVGPLLALGYVLRVDHRDAWRRPMMAGAVVAFAVILTAYLSGRHLADTQPALLDDPALRGHVLYAERLLLPTAGYFVVGMLTGLLNPRTGTLKLMLPVLLLGFAVVVLALTVLSSDAGARLLWDRVAEQF